MSQYKGGHQILLCGFCLQGGGLPPKTVTPFAPKILSVKGGGSVPPQSVTFILTKKQVSENAGLRVSFWLLLGLMTKLQKFAMVCCPSCSFKFFHSTKMKIYMGEAKWTPMIVYLMSEHWHQHYHHHCPLENSGALLSRIELPSRAMFSTPLTPALYITFHFSISWCFEHFQLFHCFQCF